MAIGEPPVAFHNGTATGAFVQPAGRDKAKVTGEAGHALRTILAASLDADMVAALGSDRLSELRSLVGGQCS